MKRRTCFVKGAEAKGSVHLSLVLSFGSLWLLQCNVMWIAYVRVPILITVGVMLVVCDLTICRTFWLSQCNVMWIAYVRVSLYASLW